MRQHHQHWLPALALLTLLIGIGYPAAAPAGRQAPTGAEAATPPHPQRVVSLIPAATEIIRALGAEAQLAGLTIHDLPAGKHNDDPRVVGGFFAPSPERIAAREPDLIIISNLHREIREHFAAKVPLLDLSANSLEQALEHIELLGSMLGRPDQAAQLVARQRHQLAEVAKALRTVPANQRPRMMRLMGTDPLAAPGDDSFQNDYIRAAGGIPPVFGRNGDIIAVSAEELARFDPQLIYVCGGRGPERVMAHQELQNLAAVRTGRVLSFDCNLTCRAGVDIGVFVSLLAREAHDGKAAPAGSHLPEDKP